MCPDCVERQALNDRLLAQMDEEKRVLIEAFVKHLARTEQTPEGRKVETKTWRRHMTKRIAAGILGVLFLVTPAGAVGPVVGPGCTASWGAVTTYTDATPIAVPVTYNVYVVSGVQTAPAVPPLLTGVTGTSAGICVGRAAGQYTVFVSAVAGGTEGAVGAAVPFVASLLVPAAPANVNVR